MAEKDKDKNVPTTEQPQPQKSSNLLSMIGIANTVLIIGLVVYIVFIKKDPPAQVIVNSDKKTESQQNKDEKNEDETNDENTDDENSKEMGETYELKGILVNLNEPGGSRMLKVSLTLEFKDIKFKDVLKKRDSQIRSEILIYLSGLNFSQTVGVSQKENILKTLKKKINQISVEGKIRNIFFSEFVVQ